MNEPLILSNGVVIPASELEVRFVRSSGPGGQHVNKTSTQVELSFNLPTSFVFSDNDRVWLLTRLANRLDSEGNLNITAQAYRSQARNRTDAIAKLRDVLDRALVRPKKRRTTKPTRAAKESRLREKKIQSERKAERGARRSL